MANQFAGGVQTQEGGIELLTELLAGASYTGAKLRLYQSSFAPTSRSTQADFVAAEVTAVGYAPATLTWGAVGVDTNGIPTLLSDRAFFQATDGTTPNLVGGAWIDAETAVGPPAVHASIDFYQFNPPVPLQLALQFVGVVIARQQPNDPGYALVDY